ncbi:MAG: hypothetical protein RL685_2634 [Pseudomonadota bacterium]|jgi:hypothetical protein
MHPAPTSSEPEPDELACVQPRALLQPASGICVITADLLLFAFNLGTGRLFTWLPLLVAFALVALAVLSIELWVHGAHFFWPGLGRGLLCAGLVAVPFPLTLPLPKYGLVGELLAESAGLGDYLLHRRDPEWRKLGRGPLVPKSAATRRRES